MLGVALGLFTIVAGFGLRLAKDVFTGQISSSRSRFLHVGTAAAGSVLVIASALNGDQRLWINIGLAVVVIALGVALCYQRAKHLQPKALVVAHGGIAVFCYAILAYFVFSPQ